MTTFNRRQFAALSAAALTPGISTAQPKRSELGKILVAFPPGGTTDQIARLLAEQLRGDVATNIIVDNRPGAAGRIAVQALKAAPSDGSTFLVQALAIQSLYPHTFKQLGYMPFADVACVSTTALLEFCIALGPSVPASIKTLKEYAAWVREDPGPRGSYATPGAGNPLHFMPLVFGRIEKIDLNPVHYRGTTAAIPDLIGGTIPASCTPVNDALPYAKDGKIRILATSGPQRNDLTPNAPTFTELGYPQMTYRDFYSVYVPGKTPLAMQEHLSASIRKALSAPAVVQGFATLYLQPAGSTPAEALKMARADYERWGRVVKDLGYQPE
jgi:tripartite-type tricarboxylate transporter receptor subunit TctC